VALPVDIHNRDQMLGIVQSSIGTKFSSRWGTQMVDMALTAVLRVVTTVDNGSEDGAKEVCTHTLVS
jgi:T-complex protein 1 subunit gamma